MEKLAFIGCGRIAEAMVAGLVASGYAAELIHGVSRTGAGSRRLSQRFGIRTDSSAAEAASRATVVVLAVHPDETTAVLGELTDVLDGRQVLVSLVASWNTRNLADLLPPVPIIRAVPNAAVAVRTGAIAITSGPGTGPVHRDRVVALFSRLGQVTEADEADMELVSTLCGAGPALISKVAVELIRAATARGLAPEQARELVGQAIHGTSGLLARSASLEEIISSVASPNGMTEAALRTLDDKALGATLGAGLDAAVRRSIERQTA